MRRICGDRKQAHPSLPRYLFQKKELASTSFGNDTSPSEGNLLPCIRQGWTIAKGSVDFGEDDPTFATAPTAGSVTQPATANIGNATEKFFKAVIEVDVSNNEDP